ncbi:MAG: membrane dipeptidase [Bacteroidales bacterium]|nr:membrane dipeptidase [Bacteroidales bacterium]
MSSGKAKKTLIFDSHLDISMNAMEWNRDQRWSVEKIRKSEEGMNDKPDRGRNTVSFPALREGRVGLVVATQIARVVKPGSPIPGWYSQEQAWAHTQGQLQWYRAMEQAGEMKQIRGADSLKESLALWENPDDHTPIAYVLSLEGADSIISMNHLERAYGDGLRAIGPAHYGPGVYANGTDSGGRLNARGVELLRTMEQLDMILDMTHLNDDAFWHALDIYKGTIWASHNNCRSIVNHNRQFSDRMILELISRKAVIGTALDAWMMVSNWIRGESDPLDRKVSLETMVNHMDHICQLAGNSLHVGIGSDLDGGYGKEQCPHDLDTIADLQKVPAILRDRGYSEEDIQNIMYLNFVRFLQDYFKEQAD